MLTPEQFVYWLQGFFELQNPQTITAVQTQEIKNHLALVFNKVTPKIPSEFIMPKIEVMDCGHLPPIEKEQRYCSLVGDKKCAGEKLHIDFLGIKLGDLASLNNTKQKEDSQIYITITNKPVWDERGTYSYYNKDNKQSKIADTFLSDLGIFDGNRTNYLIIDNDLQPPISKYNSLQGGRNHLVAAGDYCGLLNIGTFPDDESLFC